MRSAFVGLNTILVVAVVAAQLLLSETKASSTPDSDALVSHITRSRYCGRRLTETLAYLCQGRYPMLTHYRTDYYHDQQQQQQQQRVKVEVATLPDSLPPGFPYPGTGVHRRSRRSSGGIYDECCKKSCSFVELRAYCD